MEAILSPSFNYFSPLHVEFLGEVGIGLGVLREWFQKVKKISENIHNLQMSSLLKDPSASIFRLCPNGRTLEPDYSKRLIECKATVSIPWIWSCYFNSRNLLTVKLVTFSDRYIFAGLFIGLGLYN